MLSLAANPTMNRLAQLGRYFFAIPFAVFGVQYYLYGYYSGGLWPFLPWAPGARFACLLRGLMFLRTVRLHTPRVATHLNDADEWSSAFIALAMARASFLLPLFPART
jgi:hypothetical protein